MGASCILAPSVAASACIAVKRRFDHLLRQQRRSGRTDRALTMPHERDEAPETDLPRQAVVEQAHHDVERGLVDTDNYTRIAPVTSPVSTRRGGVRRRP